MQWLNKGQVSHILLALGYIAGCEKNDLIPFLHGVYDLPPMMFDFTRGPIPMNDFLAYMDNEYGNLDAVHAQIESMGDFPIDSE